MDISEEVVQYAVDAGYFDARSDIDQETAKEQVCLDVMRYLELSFEQSRTLVHNFL